MSDVLPLITPPAPSATGEIDPTAMLIGDPYEPIKQKYGNDINKLAEGYKNLQSHSDKITSSFKVPDTYQVKDEHKELIGDANLVSLTEVAKTGEFSQKQFDAMLESIYGFQKTVKTKAGEIKAAREAVLKDNVDKLKAFYVDKIPEKALLNMLENGDVEEIKTLIAFRDSSIGTKNTPTPGNNMSEVGINPAQALAEKRKELVDLSTKIPKATASDQEFMFQKRAQLANEIAEILKTQTK